MGRTPHGPWEPAVGRLTRVKGIGRWTAEMVLIVALGRPDVLPVGDLGICVALRNHFALPDLPSPRLRRMIPVCGR
jgi:DNA-3-methyladenine glycosylase II